MTSDPLVSIIMPSYNQDAYLEQAICSVLDQDYPNLEMMVVDGGSSDGSVEIIKKYAPRLAWWVSEKDHGQGDAINKGFTRARGEIVAWLNSDDLYLPGAISAGVAALQAAPDCGMVYGDTLAIDSSGQTTNIMKYGRWGLDELMRFRVIGQPAVFLRREALLKSGFVDVSYNLLLDHQLWLRVAQVTRLQHIDRVLAASRYHPAAKNRSQASGYGKDAYRVIEWMKADPQLSRRYARHSRQIWAGAHRYNAFYLLDAGQPKEALRYYLRSLACYPPAALQDCHRILFAAASLVFNLDSLRNGYNELRRKAVAKDRKVG